MLGDLKRGWLLLVLAVSSTYGCSGASVDELSTINDASCLIGGIAADSRELDAIGALVAVDVGPHCGLGRGASPHRLLCSAGLIGPNVLLTAKHCIPNLAYLGANERPFFALGPDTERPRRLVPIADWKETPFTGDGWNLIGTDIAVVFLEQEISDVKPLKLGNLKDEDVGAHFGVIGYGVRGESGGSGLRRAGTVTLRAREGSPYHLVFESFDAYATAMSDGGTAAGSDAGTSGVDAGNGVHVSDDPHDDGRSGDTLTTFRYFYDRTLSFGNEVYVGGGACDSQVCFGDSGSPLVRSENGELVAYGVASGTLTSLGMLCEHGTIYATFGGEAMALLNDAQRWTNACKSTSSAGTCEGTRATRCTRHGEGERRVITTDCATFGQTCALDHHGEASCVSTPSGNREGGIQGRDGGLSGALAGTGALGGINFFGDAGQAVCDIITGARE